MICVEGISGCGKSFLVQRFLKELEEEAKEGKTKPHCSMRGKFEELQNADPYSGLVEALVGFLS